VSLVVQQAAASSSKNTNIASAGVGGTPLALSGKEHFDLVCCEL
jgi:hypothetical protein